jgi:hypothetical protein
LELLSEAVLEESLELSEPAPGAESVEDLASERFEPLPEPEP